MYVIQFTHPPTPSCEGVQGDAAANGGPATGKDAGSENTRDIHTPVSRGGRGLLL